MITRCQQPPSDLPTEWADYVHPNCFKNIERLGKWIGGTEIIGRKESPAKCFETVAPNSIGKSGEGVNLYIVTHGWAPGLRKAADKAEGTLKWWSANAIRSDKGIWGSNWAWTGTKGEKHNLEVSPTGLFQQIEKYESKNRSGKKTISLGYTWVDDSATLPIHLLKPDTWLDAHRSEAYTNLNGLRMAAAINEATTPGFFENPNNKIHILGHSHGTKVAAIACLNLQTKGLQVDHLTILDPAEDSYCLMANVANLLGYYFDKMKIAQPSQIGLNGYTFVENYISFFGMGLAGPQGSNINNIRQIGLESGHVFHDDNISQRHAYAASWYSNASAAASANHWPPIGLDWPPVTPNPNSNYYQKLSMFSKGTWNEKQWKLHEGNLLEAGIKTYFITNPTIQINELRRSGEVDGSPDDELKFRFKNGLDAIPASFVGSFDARIPDLKGISFDLQWSNPRPNEFIVVTVESPFEEIFPKKQQIAIVLDASAFKDTGNSNTMWHPISFNTFSAVRPNTQFAIHYYPGKTWKGQYGNLSIRNFRYVKEQKG